MVPKAATPAHIYANAPEKVLAFTLTKEEMRLVSGLAWASAVPGLLPADVDDVHRFVSRRAEPTPVAATGEQGEQHQRAQDPEDASGGGVHGLNDGTSGTYKSSGSDTVDSSGRDEL